MRVDDYWQEYDIDTRHTMMAMYKLTREQSNLLVRAYDDIAVIGGLLFRSDVQKEDIRYLDKNKYSPLPRIMRDIVRGIPKDNFHKYFSPFHFEKKFPSFVKRVLTSDIQNGSDFLGVGTICYKKPARVIVASFIDYQS